MCLGVTAFAAGTSELTNLLSTYDQENSKLQSKILILNRIYKEYCLPLALYENIKSSIRYQYKNDIEELVEFIQDLPNNLKVEVSFFVFESTFRELQFFNKQPLTFIAWICPLLKPAIVGKDQFIFIDGDDISCIYFFKEGQASYVLPRHRNMRYLNLTKGKHFGIICIIASFLQKDNFSFDLDDWINHKDNLKRHFSIQCQD